MNIKYYFRLVRPVNLLIILFTIYMVRFAVIFPLFKSNGLALQVNEYTFAFFSLAFLLLAAGGYVINDIYDVKIDEVNKPGELIIVRHLSVKSAILWYLILSIAGLLSGCWSLFQMNLPWISILFFIYFSGLWFYSYLLKRTFLIGNLLIALFVAVVPLAAGLAEYGQAMNRYSMFLVNAHFLNGLAVIYGISLFAFLSTLAREMVKDAEDVEGDALAGCKTFPILMGLNATKSAVILILLVIFLPFLSLVFFFGKWQSAIIIFPILFDVMISILVVMVIRAKSATDFHKISIWLKAMMVFGICFLFLFAFLFFKTDNKFSNWHFR